MVVLITGVVMCVVGQIWQWVFKDAQAPGDKDVPFYKRTWYQIAIVLMIVGAIGMSVSGASSTHYYEEYPCMYPTKSGVPKEMVTDSNNDGPRQVVCQDNPCDNKKYCKLT
jgi:hypothetical protein